MSWFILSLLAAFLDATYFMLIKKYLERIDFYILGAGVSLFSFLITITFSIINGLPSLGRLFFPYLILTSVLETFAMILYFKALKSGEISISMPLLSFTPLFLIFTSFFILGETPSRVGIIGILFIGIGSYVLGVKEIKTDGADPFRPFKELMKNKGPRYMLIVAVFWGFETNFVKIVVQNSDPIFTAASFSLFIGIIFLGIAAAKKEDVIQGFSKNLKSFAIGGAVISFSAIAVNYAFTMQIVPYVISIKRLNILFSVIYGAVIFHETNIRSRLLGALIMTAGSIIILLF